jgi:hypothetical protein
MKHNERVEELHAALARAVSAKAAEMKAESFEVMGALVSAIGSFLMVVKDAAGEAEAEVLRTAMLQAIKLLEHGDDVKH